MAVNLSAQQLRHEALPSVVQGPSPVSASILPTWSWKSPRAPMQNPELTVRILDQLPGMGIILAIDDFGPTGYSSLAYPQHLPIQRLKLDRSFVKDIETDINDAAICSATVAPWDTTWASNWWPKAWETGAPEGIPHPVGCDVLQGFLHSRPLSAEHSPWDFHLRNPPVIPARSCGSALNLAPFGLGSAPAPGCSTD